MPDFNTLVGQDVLKRILRRALRRGQLGHALLFHGDPGQGMELAAWALARALLCQKGGEDPCNACPSCSKTEVLDHPDLQVVLALPSEVTGREYKESENPAEVVAEKYLAALAEWRESAHQTPRVEDSRQIYIAQVRHLRNWALLRSFEGGRRVALIVEAERMGEQAQNALLKLLEEPPEHFILLLCTRQPEALLPTILSRCQALALRPAPLETLAAWVAEQGLDQRSGLPARELAQLAGGNPGRAALRAEELSAAENEALWQPEGFLRDALSSQPEALYQRLLAMGEQRDRESLKRFLEELQNWLLDAELVRLLGAEAGPRVLNAHQLESLGRFAARRRAPRLDELLEELAAAIRQCDRNANIYILLLSLAQRLRRELEAIPREQPA